MKIIYHPGTGTILAADECQVFDTKDLENEGGYDSVEETLAEVDVVGIDLEALLNAVVALRSVTYGVTISQFSKKGSS